MAVRWSVIYTKKAAKLRDKLPDRVQAVLDAPVIDISATGPIRGDWPNYSKLSGGLHHRHLKRGKPTYLAVWRVQGNEIQMWSLGMLEHTKKHRTEKVQFVGSREAIDLLRKYAAGVGASVVEEPDTVDAFELTPELTTNAAGVYLRGIRIREDLTQEELAKRTGITRSNISALEHGKRPIGKETAKKLAAVLNCDYRRFL